MKKSFYLVFAAMLFTTLRVCAQTPVEHGTEITRGEVNFTELSNYLATHPQPKVMKDVEEEEPEERPVRTAISDPSLIHYRTTPTTTHAAYSHISLMPVSPAPVDTFEAYLDDNTSIPPDTHGSVDSNYCVTAINEVVRIQTRTGTVVSTVTLDAFWASVLPGGGSFDPRVHYDLMTHRWIMVAVSGAQTAQSSILIGVSKTGNPTGGWWLFKVTAYAAGTYWLDYPNVGFNKKWITVTGNLFQNTGSGFLGAKVFVFNKALLFAGTSATYTAFTQASSFTICPAFTFDSTQTSLFAVESWDGTAAGGGTTQLWKITGAVGSEAMTSVGYPASAGFNWQGQSNAVSGTGGADFAPQSGTTNKIQTNDDRIYQVVFMNNNLWFAHNVFLPYSTTSNPTRCSSQWWEIDTTGTPTQIGLLDDPTAATFYAFPSITPNFSNDALIGFTRFSTTSHPNAAYALHMHTDAVDSMETPYIYRHGQGTYFKNFGGPKCRWGDYSSTVIDPTNLTDFWTVQECSAVPVGATSYYDTWWANLKICNPLTPPTAGTVPSSPCSGSAAQYTVGAVTGATSYTWTLTGTGWSGSSTTDTASLIAGSGIGTVTVVANNSCTTSTAFTFTVAPSPLPALPVVTSPSVTPCAGSTSAIYTATSTGSTSFGWTVTGTGWSGASTTGSLTATVGAGVGRIIVHGVNACGNGANDTINVTPSTTPTAPTVALSGPIPCSGATTANYTATTTGATSYNWSVSGTGWSGASTTGTITVTLGTGTGTLICKGVNACGIGAPDTFYATTSPLPSLPVVTVPTVSPCTGATGVYTAVSSGATSYGWTVSGAGWSGSSTTGSITVTAGAGAGQLIVHGINTCGFSANDTINISPSGTPTVPTISLSGAAPCVGSTSVSYTAASTGATTYNWTVTGTGWSGSSTTSAITVTIGTGAGVITCSGTNACGTSTSTSMTINPAALPGLPVVTPPATTPCVGTSTSTYSATSTSATSFNWTVTGTGWSGAGTTATFTPSVGTAIGQIIVYGTNSCGNGPALTVNVTPSPLPGTPVVNLTSPLPCSGSATAATYVGTSTSATSYSWTVLGTGWSGSSTTGTIAVTLGTGTGSIICMGVNACGNSAPDTVSVTSSPMPSTPTVASTSGAAPCLTATTAQYFANSIGATSYTWTISGSGWSGTPTTSTDTLNMIVGSGTAIVICTGVNSCGTGIPDTAYITPSSGVGSAGSIFATSGICEGSAATFVTSGITGASSYVWTITGTGWSGSSTSTMITLTVGTTPATISVFGVSPCGDGPSYTLYSVIPVVPPTANFTIANHIIAIGSGDLITYTGSASSLGTYTWNFGGGTATPGAGVGPHMVNWSTLGLKTVTLSVTDSGCNSTTYSDTVLVVTTTELQSILSNNNNVNIVPNPNDGSFNIVFSDANNLPVNIKISDMQGRVIFESKNVVVNNNIIPVDLRNLPNAVYTATIQTESGVINKKVVVNR